ncbi:MAG TPA: DUF72 domain-containing protein [Verrucomicrobiae bacterium]|nr:DUF72 domain-containing protein [Verrucomicrobiae bacterium]
MGRAYIGTSGWSYRSWEGTFYPPRLPKTHQFDHYASCFPTVEINLTFYRLPTLKMVQNWRDRAPSGFVYAIKGSRFITHMKKLLNVREALREFFRCLDPLRRRVSVVLWQLPPFLSIDIPRLESFLKLLPKAYDHAVEFRHPSWLTRDVFAVLRQHRAAHVSVSSLAMPVDLTVTSDLVYIRFHGLEAGAAHDYSQAELEPWATHIRKQARAGKTVYAYFNNDVNARAPSNARTMMNLVGLAPDDV